MSPWLSALISALGISLLSLVGIIALSIREKILNKLLLLLVSFSAGALLGGAFFHLIPESLEGAHCPADLFRYVVVGIGLFFILERVLRWRHCHQVECDTHKHLGYLNLTGDALHNFIDGLILVSAFSVSRPLGLAVTLSVAAHELPQEIGDYGVLLYAGFTKLRALLYNFVSALFAVGGVLIGWFLVQNVANFNSVLLPITAGGFLYIAMSDLIPELHKERNLSRSLLSFAMFAAGVLVLLMV